ncbi:MAG: hypothetical protein EBU46_06050 [Nitrosomonadaceae bacterium]|nr:hypothetical protein [Nitrosomonadaceae bacterium]
MKTDDNIDPGDLWRVFGDYLMSSNDQPSSYNIEMWKQAYKMVADGYPYPSIVKPPATNYKATASQATYELPPTACELEEMYRKANNEAEAIRLKWETALTDELIELLVNNLSDRAFMFRRLDGSTGEIREGLVEYGPAHWDSVERECCLLVNRWQYRHTPMGQFDQPTVNDMAPSWASGGLEFESYFERTAGLKDDVQRFIKEQTDQHIRPVDATVVRKFKDYFTDHCAKMMAVLESIAQQPNELTPRKLDLA